MYRLLSQFYRGELCPCAEFKPVLKQLYINKEKAFRSYSVFLEKLPDELKEEFVALIDQHLDFLPDELEQNYIDGFCTGARMMIEVFASGADSRD